MNSTGKSIPLRRNIGSENFYGCESKAGSRGVVCANKRDEIAFDEVSMVVEIHPGRKKHNNIKGIGAIKKPSRRSKK